MSEPKHFYSAHAKLTVSARGYWFTSGGGKGSFGYYPHLKRKEGERLYPIYPDTQLKGDLRMAARWLGDLGYKDAKELSLELFGKDNTLESRDGQTSQGRLFVTDLELKDKSKWQDNRFQVKPRIEIEDDSRTTKGHMLVNLEMAYLDGLDLEADIYLDYYDNQAMLKRAENFIRESIKLLSGFGAFRSRGYGRGDIAMTNWCDEVCSITLQENPTGKIGLQYTLKSLTNLRSKPVDLGRSQDLVSKRYLSSDQVRGWFVNAYHKVFGNWPSIQEISSITFSDFFPSLQGDKPVQGYPTPMTTLKNEKGTVKDVFSYPDKTFSAENDERENFFATKTKPLRHSFVPANPDSQLITIDTGKRLRNSMELNFLTLEEGGLFFQEFIRKGTIFSGTVTINGGNGKILQILKKKRPVINGCIFEPDVKEITPISSEIKPPYLVISPLPFNEAVLNSRNCGYKKIEDRWMLDGANMVTIGTERKYNTMMRRPRRPRISILPGSVIVENHRSQKGLLAWEGFGKFHKEAAIDQEDAAGKGLPGNKKSGAQQEFSIDPALFKQLLEDVTSAQAGIIREFLNEKRNISEIKKVVKSRIGKYGKKRKPGLEAVYKEILNLLEADDSGVKMRKYVNFILDRLNDEWWKRLSRRRPGE